MMSTENGPIVVGVDGSTTSIEALRAAARLGAALNLPILAITTWTIDPLLAGYAPVDPSQLEQSARAVLEQATAAAFGGEPPVDLAAKVVYGPAATTLVEESANASMLVVGSRGLGGFKGMLLGSVSVACVNHAHCPVLVIRPEDS